MYTNDYQTREKKKIGELNPEVISDGTKPIQNDENDIFGELLAGTSATAGKTPNKQSLKALKNMTLIDAGSAVLFEQGLKTFIPVGDKMVCCRASDQRYILSLFGTVAPNSNVLMPVYEALPELKTKVEVPSLMSSWEESQGHTLWSYTPQLCCVQPSSSVSCSSLYPVMERPLFNKLFNWEASLLDSPVVLFGGEDGQILFWPVNSFALTSRNPGTLGSKQSFTPQLLYHLEQRVSAIYAANIHCQKDSSGGSNAKRKKESSVYCCNALVFVGDYDKIVIACERKPVKTDEGGAIRFSGHTILGPVLCSCLTNSGDTLVHSTGREIFVTRLSLNDTTDATSSAPVVSSCTLSLFTTLSMQVPNICTVCCVHKKNKTTGTVTLAYALNMNGRLLQFVLPDLQDGESHVYSNVSPQMAGQKVKSYLSEIETRSAELAKVNATIETEDRILTELNMVIHTVCQFPKDAAVSGIDTTPQQSMCPISCTFTPSLLPYDSSGNSSVSLHCKVVNQGSLMLSSSWSLLVQLQGQEPWCCRVTADSHTIGRSVPLKIFNPGSFIEIDMPLSKSFSSSVHIVAEVYLYCNLNSLLAGLRKDPNSGNFSEKPVEDVLIPISRRVFDVLHFVRPHQMGTHVSVKNPVAGSKEELLQTLDKLKSEIQFTINKEDLFGQSGAENAEKSLQFGSYSASFLVSQDAICFMKIAVQNSSAHNATQETVQTLTPQAIVLHFILTDSSISHEQIDSKYSGIELLTVDGSQASIRLKPAAGSVTSAPDGPPMEVALHCSSIPLLCCLHGAVLVRFQVS